MISHKTLVALGLRVDTGCPDEWTTAVTRQRRTRSVVPHVHMCVGDVGHGGKHVCPCGALRYVWVVTT